VLLFSIAKKGEIGRMLIIMYRVGIDADGESAYQMTLKFKKD
jgi:hypothetical protein